MKKMPREYWRRIAELSRFVFTKLFDLEQIFLCSFCNNANGYACTKFNIDGNVQWI